MSSFKSSFKSSPKILIIFLQNHMNMHRPTTLTLTDLKF